MLLMLCDPLGHYLVTLTLIIRRKVLSIKGDRYLSVTGLGPGYIIPGPWPELTPLAL